MGDVQIKTLRNGPYQVKGPIELVDARGQAFRLDEDTIYLCRCGQSTTKPFCDGTHNTCGFQGEDPAR